MSLSIFFTYAAFTCLVNSESYILLCIREENPKYKVSSYLALTLTYTIIAITVFIIPIFVLAIGSRTSVFIGTCLVIIYFGQFFIYNRWCFYLASLTAGIGASLIWLGGFYYITLNSTQKNIAEHLIYSWTIIISSVVVGNVIFHFIVMDNKVIDKIKIIFSAMTISAMIGCLILFFAERSAFKFKIEKPTELIMYCLKPIVGRDMFLLCVTFTYIGLETSFTMGCFTNAAGFTKNISETPSNIFQLINFFSILIGFGDMFGAMIFLVRERREGVKKRWPVILLGYCVHNVAYSIIFLNLPNSSPNGPTREGAVIVSHKYLAYVSSVLLGFGDSCFKTQVLSTLGDVFGYQMVAALPIYMFFENLAAATAFSYMPLGLYVVLGVLFSLSLLGTISFILVELKPSYGSGRNNVYVLREFYFGEDDDALAEENEEELYVWDLNDFD